PKSGHVLNLEEPALFNEMVERFIALVEAGRWPVRDARSMVAVAVGAVIASEAKQSMSRRAERWIASSLSLLAMTVVATSPPHPYSAKTHPARRTCSRPTRAGSAAPGGRRDRALRRAPS